MEPLACWRFFLIYELVLAMTFCYARSSSMQQILAIIALSMVPVLLLQLVVIYHTYGDYRHATNENSQYTDNGFRYSLRTDSFGYILSLELHFPRDQIPRDIEEKVLYMPTSFRTTSACRRCFLFRYDRSLNSYYSRNTRIPIRGYDNVIFLNRMKGKFSANGMVFFPSYGKISNRPSMSEARAVKDQRRRRQMEKLRRLRHAGAPVRGRHMARQMAWSLARARLTLANDLRAEARRSDCFDVTLLVQMVHFTFSLRQDVHKSWKSFTYMVGIALVCSLQNLYEASVIPSKSQVAVSRDPEYTLNRSGSDPSWAAEHDDGINSVAKNAAATWLVASAATHHATGNSSLLSGFTCVDDLYIKAGDGGVSSSMPVRGRGSVVTDTVVLPNVWFVPGLTKNIVSASQLVELDYSVGFARGVCSIRSATDGTLIGRAPTGEDGLFHLDFLRVPLL